MMFLCRLKQVIYSLKILNIILLKYQIYDVLKKVKYSFNIKIKYMYLVINIYLVKYIFKTLINLIYFKNFNENLKTFINIIASFISIVY